MEKRQLKFRAYSKRNKIMYEVFSFCKEFIKVIIPENGNNPAKIEIEEFEPLMQFTGLKDKNDIDIFEDDLITAFDGVFQIVFRDGAFYAKRGSIMFRISRTFVAQEEIIIIGNIHQNPELLKTKII